MLIWQSNESLKVV